MLPKNLQNRQRITEQIFPYLSYGQYCESTAHFLLFTNVRLFYGISDFHNIKYPRPSKRELQTTETLRKRGFYTKNGLFS